MQTQLGERFLEPFFDPSPISPRFAFIRTPLWNRADEDARSSYEAFIMRIGRYLEEVELPPIFDRAVECHTTIYDANVAQRFAEEYARNAAQISPYFKKRIEKGNRILATDYIREIQLVVEFCQALEKIFDRYDAILTPAAPSEAPLGPDATGRAFFAIIWTLCGTPTISIPVLKGGSGMPLGVQLVGRKNTDARLLRMARWLVDFAPA